MAAKGKYHQVTVEPFIGRAPRSYAGMTIIGDFVDTWGNRVLTLKRADVSGLSELAVKAAQANAKKHNAEVIENVLKLGK